MRVGNVDSVCMLYAHLNLWSFTKSCIGMQIAKLQSNQYIGYDML